MCRGNGREEVGRPTSSRIRRTKTTSSSGMNAGRGSIGAPSRACQRCFAPCASRAVTRFARPKREGRVQGGPLRGTAVQHQKFLTTEKRVTFVMMDLGAARGVGAGATRGEGGGAAARAGRAACGGEKVPRVSGLNH
jgi:hypothetical protein